MSLSVAEIESLLNILNTNLNVKNSERIYVLANYPDDFSGADKNKAKDLLEMAETLVEKGKGIADIKLIISHTSGNHGIEPAENVWYEIFGDFIDELKNQGLFERLLKKELRQEEKSFVRNKLSEKQNVKADGIIALTYYSTSHTFFRNLLTDIVGTRYASMPLFEKFMLRGSMNVDYFKIKERADKILKILNNAVNIEITAPNGTTLNFSVKEREFLADTGILTERGAFGNLPAGEVFTAPVEGTASGKYIIEYGPEEGKLDFPIEAIIDNGKVVNINGKGRLVDLLNGKFEEDKRCRNIAELGIGINNGAIHTENILEAEKILGTIHVAFGDNSSFGGNVQAPMHIDFVLFNPTVKVEKNNGETLFLLKNGKLLI